MKTKNTFVIGIGILIMILSIIYFGGIKNPPNQLIAADLSPIQTVSVNQGTADRLTIPEIEFWKKQEFEISTENYPGETPDYIIKLSGTKNDFTALYNNNSNKVFFIFIPEVEYGFLNSPPSGGWSQPIYETHANEKLLEFLRIK